VFEKETARLIQAGSGLPCSRLFDRVDGVIALGGDGTVLRVARQLAGRDLPILGVNIGGLGFLTSVAERDVVKALRYAADGRCDIAVRSVAEVVVMRKGKRKGFYRALNDAVIGRVSSSRMLTLEVSVDASVVTSYQCDGIIVSTPTGSTGHSLSAGGPILTPETPAFVLTLICPHTLSWRPVVVPDTRLISIRVVTDAEQQLTVDGQVGQVLCKGDEISVCRSSSGVRFLHLPGHSYFAVLRQKLHWSGSNLPTSTT